MNEWMVSVEWDTEYPLTEDELTAVAEMGGAAGGGIGGHRLGSTMTIEAGNPADAVAVLEKRLHALLPGEVASVTVSTIAYADEQLARPAFPELVGVSEVAQLLQVTRQRASALQTHPLFPAPVALLSSGPVWRRDDLTTFEEEWDRRPGRPAKGTP